MICGSHLIKNTKAELFIKKVRINKILVMKMKRFNRPICFMAIRNSKF